eukprot:76731_1
MARKFLTTLKYMHEQGVIHRDIKPENILYRQQNDNNVDVMFIDFGHSKIINEEEDKRKRNVNIGDDANVDDLFGFSRGYAAPEQLDDKMVHKKSDIHGAGYTILFMITGFDIRKVQLRDYEDIDEDLYSSLGSGKVIQKFVDFPQLGVQFDKLGISLSFETLIDDMTRRNINNRPTAHECLLSPWISTFPKVIETKKFKFDNDMSLGAYYGLFQNVEKSYNELYKLAENVKVGRDPPLEVIKKKSFRIGWTERLAFIGKRHQNRSVVDCGIVETNGRHLCPAVTPEKRLCKSLEKRESDFLGGQITGSPMAHLRQHLASKTKHPDAFRQCGHFCNELHVLSNDQKNKKTLQQECLLAKDKLEIYFDFIDDGKLEPFGEVFLFDDDNDNDNKDENDEKRNIYYFVMQTDEISANVHDSSKKGCKIHDMSNTWTLCETVQGIKTEKKEENEEKKDDNVDTIVVIDLQCLRCGVFDFSHLAHVYMCNKCKEICCCRCGNNLDEVNNFPLNSFNNIDNKKKKKKHTKKKKNEKMKNKKSDDSDPDWTPPDYVQ